MLAYLFFKVLTYELIVIFLATVKSRGENFLRFSILIENNQFFTRGFCGFFAFHSALTKSSGCSYWVGGGGFVYVSVCLIINNSNSSWISAANWFYNESLKSNIWCFSNNTKKTTRNQWAELQFQRQSYSPTPSLLHPSFYWGRE